MSTPKNWDYFESGEELKDAGLIILKPSWKAATQADTNYKVRFLCCGDERIASHKLISRRITRKSKLCDECTRKHTGKTTKPSKQQVPVTWLHGVWCPSTRVWPVPPSIRK